MENISSGVKKLGSFAFFLGIGTDLAGLLSRYPSRQRNLKKELKEASFLPMVAPE